MYFRKASLDHLPIIMMEKVGTSARYIAMAAPERMECVPISFPVKPSLSTPMSSTAERSFVRTVADEMVEILSLRKIVFTVDVSSVPG